MKGIFAALLKTVAITYPVSLIINLAWAALERPFNARDFGMVGLLLVVGTLYIIIILLALSLPALFLKDEDWWIKPVLRFSLYFGGPLLFVTGILFSGFQGGDMAVYLTIGLIYIIIHAIFYKKLLRKHRQAIADTR